MLRIRPLHSLLTLVVLPVLGCGLGSGCSGDPNAPTLYQNVGDAFAECEGARIKSLTEKHGLKAALSYCGSNRIHRFAWNPADEFLYFDLTHTTHILNASNKGMDPIPVDKPVGQPAWMTENRLVIPVEANARDEAHKERIALFDVVQHTLEYKHVSQHKIDDLARGDGPSDILFTGEDDARVRRAWHLDLDTGTVKAAFSWLPGPVDTLTYSAKHHALLVGVGDTVTWYDTTDGSVKRTWASATRGSFDPFGRFVALEHEGQEVSVFYQRGWDELSDAARQRELVKAKALEDSLPEWAPKRVRLPTISFVDLQDRPDERYEVQSFYGTRFQWFEEHKYWGSFMLWGYEGRQFNRNVILGDLSQTLYAVSQGKESRKLRRFAPDATPAQAP